MQFNFTYAGTWLIYKLDIDTYLVFSSSPSKASGDIVVFFEVITSLGALCTFLVGSEID